MRNILIGFVLGSTFMFGLSAITSLAGSEDYLKRGVDKDWGARQGYYNDPKQDWTPGFLEEEAFSPKRRNPC